MPTTLTDGSEVPTLDEHIAASQQNTADLQAMRKAYDDIEPIASGQYASAKAADAGDLDEHEPLGASVQIFRRFGGYKLLAPMGPISAVDFVNEYTKDPTRKPADVVAAVHAEMAAAEVAEVEAKEA